nr:hypothetical protein [Nonomuraea guangzhouensis]
MTSGISANTEIGKAIADRVRIDPLGGLMDTVTEKVVKRRTPLLASREKGRSMMCGLHRITLTSPANGLAAPSEGTPDWSVSRCAVGVESKVIDTVVWADDPAFSVAAATSPCPVPIIRVVDYRPVGKTVATCVPAGTGRRRCDEQRTPFEVGVAVEAQPGPRARIGGARFCVCHGRADRKADECD